MMVREYGMSEALGPVALVESQRSAFLGPGIGAPELRSYSEQTAKRVDDEVRRLVQEGLDRARATINENKARLQRLAAKLLITEVVDEEELRQILGEKARAQSPLLAPHNEDETEVRAHEPPPAFPAVE